MSKDISIKSTIPAIVLVVFLRMSSPVSYDYDCRESGCKVINIQKTSVTHLANSQIDEGDTEWAFAGTTGPIIDTEWA